MFFDLMGKHQNLYPVRVAGSTKEFTFFGGRVGFMTFPFAQESAVGQALDNKTQCMLRAGVGSPVATTQVILLRALRDPTVDQQVAESLERLRRRFVTVSESLADVEPEILRTMPSNSGVFTLLELPSSLDPEAVRLHLIEKHQTGIVSIAPNYLRIAFCSVDESDLPELVRRVALGVRELL
jgi:aspartate/methionine/tyrosine aminotransferase